MCYPCSRSEVLPMLPVAQARSCAPGKGAWRLLERVDLLVQLVGADLLGVGRHHRIDQLLISARSAKGMRLSLPAFSSASIFCASSEDSICRPCASASLPALSTACCRSAGRLLKAGW